MIVDASGACLKRAVGGPVNVVVVGADRARDALRQIMPPNGRFASIVAGIAGADRPWVRRFWEQELGLWSSHVWVVGDYRIAWAALAEGGPGVVAIFGTGSVFYGESRGRMARIGGYGWKIGDVGSGLSLGRAAVRAALADLDGWGPRTSLTPDVLRWADAKDSGGILDSAYAPERSWRRVSDLAANVFEAADRGDEAALHIVNREADEALAHLVSVCVATGVGRDGVVGLAGGLARRWLPWLASVWQASGGGPLHVVDREPVEGAAAMARAWHLQEQGE